MKHLSSSSTAIAGAQLVALLLVVACGEVAPSGPGSPRDAAAERDVSRPTDARSPEDSGRDSPIIADSGPPDSRPPGDSSPPTDSSHPGPIPVNHRPNDSQCSQPAQPGECGVGTVPTMSCTKDSECTMGVDGRCLNYMDVIGCYCTYDTCTHDTDCPTGQLCACHGSVYSEGAGNACIPGDCRVDSDCGLNGYCSPTAGGECGATSGYFCHTPADTCLNDTDCGADGPPDQCRWSATDHHWECQPELFCG